MDGLYDTRGDRVYMGIKSTFFILSNTNVYWENNHAALGGTISMSELLAL